MTRRARDLFPRLVDPDGLDAAARDTCRGKGTRPDVAWFLFHRERVLARLVAELNAGTWRPRGFDALHVKDPKPRVIARAPFADRVVHSALVRAMEPHLSRSWAPEDFACRPGMGTHRALLALWAAVRRHRFCVHLDIRSYFPSVDLERLRALLARRVDDARFLTVLDAVLESGRGFYDPPGVRHAAGIDADWPPPGRGLPIGARTSQLLAGHVYLEDLDRLVKRTCRAPAYVRYVDDLFVFGDRRADLRAWRGAIGEWLEVHRGLRLKHPHARVLACAGHVDGLGHRVSRAGIEPLPERLARLVGKARQCLRRRIIGRRGREEMLVSLEGRTSGLWMPFGGVGSG